MVDHTSSVLIITSMLSQSDGNPLVVRPGSALLGKSFDVVMADGSLKRDYLDQVKCRIRPGGKFFLIYADQ